MTSPFCECWCLCLPTGTGSPAGAGAVSVLQNSEESVLLLKTGQGRVPVVGRVYIGGKGTGIESGCAGASGETCLPH